jgi:hypothetical protein
MSEQDRQWRCSSESPINWHALFSWIVIIVGFSVATFLFLL